MSKTTRQNAAPLPITDLLADYLNGHLSATDTRRVESALQHNPQLQEQHEFERRLQQALRAEASAQNRVVIAAGARAEDASFESIAGRLTAPKLKTGSTAGGPSRSLFGWLNPFHPDASWLRVGVPAAALVVLAVALPLSQAPTQSGAATESINVFETLADSTETFTQPTLRLNLHPGTGSEKLDELLDRYSLRLATAYPDSNTFDVVPSSRAADVAALGQQLQAETSVRLAKVLGDQ